MLFKTIYGHVIKNKSWACYLKKLWPCYLKQVMGMLFKKVMAMLFKTSHVYVI